MVDMHSAEELDKSSLRHHAFGHTREKYPNTRTECALIVGIVAWKLERLLVVFAPGDDLLARRPQQDGVLELRRVAPLDVAQRWVRLHYALLAEVLGTNIFPNYWSEGDR